MKITDLLSIKTINLKVKANDKTDVLKQAVKLISASGNISDVATYETGVFNREKESTTGVGEGIAIPHCKSKAVKNPTLAAMVIPNGVEYASLDGEPVNVLFLIAAPVSKSNVHLDVLAKLSTLLMHPEFKENLLKAKTPKAFMKVIDEAEKESEIKEQNNTEKIYPRILAVTACPTGIAHTYMAQEALEKTAKKRGIAIKVQTNGSGGIKNELTAEEIAHAEAIIIAADVTVPMDCFNGKRLVQCPVTKAISKPNDVIDIALDPSTAIYNNGRTSTKQTKQTKNQTGNKFQAFYRHLMSGISHMIPFVIAGGISLALAYLIDNLSGIPQEEIQNLGNWSLGAQIFHFIGVDFGLALMFPILGGFIAYSIAGKPGLVAGFIGAAAAKEGRFSLLYFILSVQSPSDPWLDKLAKSSSGFLGAIMAGFMAGYLILFLNKKTARCPRSIAGVKDMLLVPLFSSLLVAGAMSLINVPLAYINIGISQGLTALSKIPSAGLLLGALAGGLMAIDMGGPINKATHYAIVGIVTSAVNKGLPPTDPEYIFALQLNAANLLGMLTPPAGIALATWLFPQKFAKEDRNPSIANFVTGCCGITEGAIPYVVKNPVSTIIATVAGAACGGVISMQLGFTAIAPEGGFIGMVASNPQDFWRGVVACMSGALITALILGFARKDVTTDDSQLGRWKGIPTQPVYNGFAKVGHFFAKPFKKKKTTEKSDKQ